MPNSKIKKPQSNGVGKADPRHPATRIVLSLSRVGERAMLFVEKQVLDLSDGQGRPARGRSC